MSDTLSGSKNKAQTLFHVSKAGANDGESFGPWTIEDIAERLAKSEIAVTDFVFEDERQDWVTLVEFEALKQHLRRSKPKAPPAKAIQTAPQVIEPVATPEIAVATRGPGGEWFVQKGTHRSGPYSYLSLVRALQEKTVYEFDFVWTEGMADWLRLAEHEAFDSGKIRELAIDKASKVESIFTKRAHPRIRFESDVIVHDDKSAWAGRAFEGSVGGSGLIIENPNLLPGQTVKLHFGATEGLPSFVVTAEIVNKKFVKKLKGKRAPVQYAVRFLDMDEKAKEQVTDYFSRSKAA